MKSTKCVGWPPILIHSARYSEQAKNCDRITSCYTALLYWVTTIYSAARGFLILLWPLLLFQSHS